MSDWSGDKVRDDGRWKYGAPPVGNANYGWLQRILHHLAPNGTAAVILAKGSMSSNQGGEGDIRKAMVEGVHVAYRDPEPGRDVHVQARIVDLSDPANNDLLVTAEFTVVERETKRRADIVVFVNGLPLAIIDLKNPTSDTASLSTAVSQLQTYKAQTPSLFRTNAALIIAVGLTARVGSLTANEERFMPWRTVDGRETLRKGHPETATLIEGVLAPERLLEIVRDFTAFMDHGTGLVKILAGYHQLHAVKHAVDHTVAATSPAGGITLIFRAPVPFYGHLQDTLLSRQSSRT